MFKETLINQRFLNENEPYRIQDLRQSVMNVTAKEGISIGKAPKGRTVSQEVCLEKKRKILIYGDSNTYGYDPADFVEGRYPADVRWTSLLAKALKDDWELIEEGLNGRRLPDLSHDEERVKGFLKGLSSEDLFAVMLGGNDILIVQDPDAAIPFRRMEELLKFLKEQEEKPGILVIGPVPAGGEHLADPYWRKVYRECLKMNEGFGKLSRKYGQRFLDAAAWQVELCFDFVHFSENGHRRFAECMEKSLCSLVD